MSDEYETENYLDANGKRWVWIDHVNQIVGRLERELSDLKAENERLREALQEARDYLVTEVGFEPEDFGELVPKMKQALAHTGG